MGGSLFGAEGLLTNAATVLVKDRYGGRGSALERWVGVVKGHDGSRCHVVVLAGSV